MGTVKAIIVNCKGCIQATPFKIFCERVRKDFNGKLDLQKHEYLENTFDNDTVVKRARNKLGYGDYNLITKNCETFAVWCKTGKAQSIQSLTNFEFALDVSIKHCDIMFAPTLAFAVLIGHNIVSNGNEQFMDQDQEKKQLETFQRLIQMEFNEDEAWRVSKKYKGNLDKCIDCLLQR